MDDNKLNPDLENQLEDLLNAEPTDDVQAEDSGEVSDYERFMEAQEADATESEDATTLEDADEIISDEPQFGDEVPLGGDEPSKKAKGKKKGLIAILIILVLIIIGATAFLVSMIVKNNGSTVDSSKTVMSINDVSSDIGEFINVYSYYASYNSYYQQISDEQLRELSLEQLQFINTLYIKAVEAGYTLSEADIAEIDANVTSIAEGAEAYSMSVSEYLEENVGPKYNEEMFRAYLEKQTLAQKYYTDEMEKIQSSLTGNAAEVEKKYAEAKTDYDIAAAQYFYFESSDASAESKADALISAVTKSRNFAAEVKAATGDNTSAPQELSFAKSVIAANFSEEAANWIYETDDSGNYVNGEGSAEKFVSGGMIYVVYVNDVPGRDETIPVNVEYIKVDIGTDTTIKSAAELEAASKSIADTLYNGAKDSGKTLNAIYNTSDYAENDLVDCDVYEQLNDNSGIDAAVEAWCFDESRKAGDIGLVEGEDGWYILRFDSKEENAVWYQTAYETLMNDTMTKWQDDLTHEFDEIVVLDEEAISEAIAYITSKVSANVAY